MKSLRELQTFQLGSNAFKTLPSCLWDLGALKVLNLSGNLRLQDLDSRILSIVSLNDLDTSLCASLRSPPYEVCQQGIDAVKQYYKDIAESSSSNIALATVVVIGRSGAGKTSLIKTLQSKTKQRVLTDRSPGNLNDQATRVFNFEEVEVHNMALRFIDMGGHEVYHIAYQLTFRQNCVPVIVVSMCEYQELEALVGKREAVRRLYLDSMAHLYLSQSDIRPPILVLTHKDKFSSEEFSSLKEQFCSTSDDVRNTIIAEDNLCKDPKFQKIKHLSNVNIPVFETRNIYEIGDETTNYATFDLMKASLHRACMEYVKEVPKIWAKVNQAVSDLAGCVQSLPSIASALRQTLKVDKSQLRIILTYMHDCGKLLWYKNVESLAPCIFHKTEEVTRLLNVLYDHDESNRWKQREERFESSSAIVVVEQYRKLVDQFKATGMMAEDLLNYFIKLESGFQSDADFIVAINILKSFKLIHGPIEREEGSCYIIPYFSSGYLDGSLNTDGNLNFHVDLLFKGLFLPAYVYHQMSLAVFELFPSQTDTAVVKSNGAIVFCGDLVVSLIHDSKSKKVAIKVDTDLEKIAEAWKILMDVTITTIQSTLKTWEAAKLVCVFYCPHCRLAACDHPDIEFNPSWCGLGKRPGSFSLRTPGTKGSLKSVICKQDRTVPSALKFPCKLCMHYYKYYLLFGISGLSNLAKIILFTLLEPLLINVALCTCRAITIYVSLCEDFNISIR